MKCPTCSGEIKRVARGSPYSHCRDCGTLTGKSRPATTKPKLFVEMRLFIAAFTAHRPWRDDPDFEKKAEELYRRATRSFDAADGGD